MSSHNNTELPPLLSREELQSALEVVRNAPMGIRTTPMLMVADTISESGK